MCVARREQEVAHPHEIRVRHHRIHELTRHTPPTVLRQHEDVAEPREGRAISHDARESDLRATAASERAEAQRAFETPLEEIAGHPRRPIRVLVQETEDDVAIDRV